MATDVKKHTTIAAAETPSRAALAAAILSISDVIPVANATEATQVASAVAASGQNLATAPVVVSRADARGLHRVEYSYDGTVWIPASGVPSFASKGAADTWAAANGALLSSGDVCRVGAAVYTWTGTVWLATDTGWVPVTFANSWIDATSLEAVEYRRLNGVTYIKGRPALGTTGTGFTLPAGFRPKQLLSFTIRSAGGSSTTNVDVQADGQVKLITGMQPYLGAISFPADA